ncbi:hypothetical protein C7H19_21720 [Aphanothece hegewaldii CCALA 016]|uniref:DDE transposase family protein n=1 Tax=Aphanothece hegewaldii CCALA 016 TaxID=2107694 RepID=A0A2T1LS42_9CHRO|nr:hypothetical protein [Aphanothece hegewaldii]PSF32253.1 hypothetical protein C7H19_21720 [Aphanothece hegewaldii CCALA 016]
MSDNTHTWYIVKKENGSCQIVELGTEQTPTEEKWWGPFPSHEDAIARRVGLIRSGKCQPQ